MKHIILEGKMSSGKSSTIKAVAEKLKPSVVYSVGNGCPIDIDSIFNGTYIIKYDGKLILIVAGSPTEQHNTITDIINSAQEFAQKTFNDKIVFALIAKRKIERRVGYKTIIELNALSEEVHREKINYIEETTEENLQANPVFIERINRIYNIIINSLS